MPKFKEESEVTGPVRNRRTKRTYVIEYRHDPTVIRQYNNGSQYKPNLNWMPWGKYKTEKDRDKALEFLNRKRTTSYWRNYEFRIKEDGNKE